MKKTISLFILLLATVCHAQETDTIANPLDGIYEYSPQNDSLIISRYMTHLNQQFVEYDEDGNRYEINARYNDAQVVYAPDDAFKVFCFSGDQCGAHCNSMFTSVTQYASGVFERDSGFSTIVSLQKIGEGLYAVVSSDWSGGLMGGSSLGLSIYTLGRNSLEAEQMFNSGTGWPGSIAVNYGDSTYSFSINSPWWGDYDRFSLRFDPKTYKISYSYTYSKGYDNDYADYIPKNVRPKDDNAEAVQITGEFILDKGEITKFKEQFEKIKLPRD